MRIRTAVRAAVVAVLGAGLLVAAPVAAVAAAPAITVTPAKVVPGAHVTVSGTGFGASERVNVYFDSTQLLFAATKPTGAFGPVTITVPASASSTTHYISAEGAHSGLFAQKSLVVNVDWPVQGFDGNGRSNNYFENTLTSSNAGALEVWWQRPVSDFGNYTPFVLLNSVLYDEDVNGAISAVNANTGAVIWRAALSAVSTPTAPVALGARVFFADGNGDIVAFGVRCATRGATCTPLWRHSIGSSTSRGLAVHAGAIYASSPDGTVHVLNPATGAETQTPLGAASSNGATGPITFNPDGGFAYPQGTNVYLNFPCCSGTYGYSGSVAPLASTGGHDVFTTSDGMLHSLGGPYWNVALGTVSCAANADVAIANGYAFASSCSAIGAYSLATGAAAWQVSNAGGASGVSVAGDVVYACVNGLISAYYLSYGGTLWTGGSCSGQPIVANGTLYVSGNGQLYAYRVNGAAPTVRRPTATQLG